MPTAIVNFRTLQNGGYKWLKRGQRRGWWRVLVVADPAKSKQVTAHNVLDVIYDGPEGIDGVTERSAYHIGGSRQRAIEVAAAYNKRAGA